LLGSFKWSQISKPSRIGVVGSSIQQIDDSRELSDDEVISGEPGNDA
jgi:hypothetical protein